MAGSISDVQTVRSFVPEYTWMTPAQLSSAIQIIIAAPSAGRNVIAEVGLQNRGATDAIVRFFDNQTVIGNWEIVAGGSIVVSWTDSLEGELSVGAPFRIGSDSADVHLTHGRYYVAAS